MVRIGPGLVPAPSQSIIEFQPNGVIELRLNTGLPPDRVHNYVSVQFARTIAGIRFNTADPALLDGFAYWASENTHNPFYSGTIGETSPRAACAAAPGITFGDRAPFFYYADASLPFVRAELTGGTQAARERFLALFDATADALTSDVLDDLHQRVADDCQWYLGMFPPPQELFVEAPPGRPDLADLNQVQFAFNAMSQRTGLDARGHHFLVRYVNVVPGNFEVDIDNSDAGRSVIMMRADLAPELRFTDLRWEFASAFVGGLYGGPTIVQRGFATWAAQDARNPILSGAAATRQLCSTVPQSELLTGQTNRAVYLASLPFVQAEKQGGPEAAQQLLREAFNVPDLARSWADRVSRACSAVP